MESVSSCSPQAPHGDMIRPYSSLTRNRPTSSHSIAGQAHLIAGKRQVHAVTDDGRDDELVPIKPRSEAIETEAVPDDTLSAKKEGFPRESMDRRRPDPRFAEANSHGYSFWNQSSTWYPRRNHFVANASCHAFERVSRHSGMVPISHEITQVGTLHPKHSSPYHPKHSRVIPHQVGAAEWHRGHHGRPHAPHTSSARGGRLTSLGVPMSRVVIPNNIVIPREITVSTVSRESASPTEESIGKRSIESQSSSPSPPPAAKRAKTREALEGFDKLDLLCTATLELGPLQDNPAGCSCPKVRIKPLLWQYRAEDPSQFSILFSRSALHFIVIVSKPDVDAIRRTARV